MLMEIQTGESAVICSTEVLESLSESIDAAKNLLEISQESNGPESTTDLRSVEAGLEGIVKQMGETLQSIPESTFDEEEYIGVVVQSLSNEMQNANIGDGSKNEITQNVQQKISVRQTPEMVSEQIETDLYPTDPEFSYESYLSESQSQMSEIPDIPSQSTYASSQRKYASLSESVSMLPQVTQFMEPPYQAFICPLTKEIMEDPVTTETGVTCERKAVTEWFDRLENPEEISCPITGQKMTTGLSPNVVLKTIIQEWKVRNEAARIKVAHAALSLGGSEIMVIDALRDLQMTCEGKEYNKIQVREAGIIQLLDRYLTYRSKDVRYELLQLLRILAEEDTDKGKVGPLSFTYDARAISYMICAGQFLCPSNLKTFRKPVTLTCSLGSMLNYLFHIFIVQKSSSCFNRLLYFKVILQEMIVKTITMSCVIKLLGSSHQPVRHAALVLLRELSKSQHACEKIGTATGAILMLVTSKYNRELDAFASETADQILRDLEKFPDNIKQMAESGLLEPLLTHLAEGNSLPLFSPKFMKHICNTTRKAKPGVK